MEMNSKTLWILGILIFLNGLMNTSVKAGEVHLKLPTDMNGYQVKILDEHGEVCGSEIPDIRGEARITIPEDKESQVLILRDEMVSLQEIDRFSILLRIKENAGLLAFAFLSGLGISWLRFKKRYRRIFEWIEDPEVDD